MNSKIKQSGSAMFTYNNKKHPIRDFYDLLDDNINNNGFSVIRCLSKRNLSLKTFGLNQLTYRMINHWSNIGLIDDTRKTNKGWRKFSLTDICWLIIALKIKEYGLSLNQMLLTKESLFKKFNDSNTERMSILNYWISRAICLKEQVFLIVFKNGWAEIISEKKLASSDFFNGRDYLSIDLSTLLAPLFERKEFQPLVHFSKSFNMEVSEPEAKIINALRTEDVDCITVKKKNGEIVFLEMAKTLAPEDDINEQLKKVPYGVVTVHNQDGKRILSVLKIKQKI